MTLENLPHPGYGRHGCACEETVIWCLRWPVKRDGLWTRQYGSGEGCDNDRRLESGPFYFLNHLVLSVLVYGVHV